MQTITQSTCSVIPKHMLRHAATHGDTQQRKRVAATLAQTERLANERAATLIQTPAAPSGRMNRQVYDAGNRQTLPGRRVMTEQHPDSSDAEAREAFDGAGAVYDFFAKVFLHNSIDGRGMRLDSTVHYGKQFDNAMWNGRQIVYGDGDGKLFNRFTAALDVIGHEFTHGVTQHTAALEYHGQTGALNEHLSDAFGIMIKQYRYGITATRSDWLIGAGLLGPSVRGVAVRSMKAPGTAYDDPVLGKDPQPSHMRQYSSTADDNGGVHINSGILNRAFCLAATALGGFAWTVAGRVWWEVLMTKLFAQARFTDFSRATVIAAGELYGIGGTVQLTIFDAWSAVGLNVPVSLTRSSTGGTLPPTAA